MEFAFTAIDFTGTRIERRLSAKDPDEAVRRLQEQGYIVLSIDAAGDDSENGGGGMGAGRIGDLFTGIFGRRVKQDQVVGLTREFAIMIEAGVPVIEALSALIEHSDTPMIRDALLVVHADLAEGKSMAEAFGAHPNIFPRLYVDMVRTAEVGASLDTTLNQAADYLEGAMEMRRKVSSAMTYPVVLLVVMVVVILFMVVFLLPRFGVMFKQMGAVIPPQMQVMLAVGGFLRRYWWSMPLFGFGTFAGARAFLRSPAGGDLFARWTLKIPVVGDTIQKIAIARSLRALGTLLGSGVSLMVALETVSRTSGNVVYERGILEIRREVEQGTSLTNATTGTGLFPGIVCQMIAVGERSGRMTHVLLHVAKFYERVVDMRLKTLATIIEPVMIVLLGLVVGFLAVSIFGPLYSIYDNVK